MRLLQRSYLYLVPLLILVGCGTTESSYNDLNSYESQEIMVMGETSANEQKRTDFVSSRQNRVVIKNAEITIATDEREKVHSRVEELAESMGGFLEYASLSRTLVRIPADSLKFALQRIEEMGKVESKSVSRTDITGSYQNLEIRLDNALNARKRYQELLKQANSVEAAVKVEKELERLNNEIDRLESRFRRMKEDVAYSTIEVNTQNLIKPGILGYVFKALYKGISWLFVRT